MVERGPSVAVPFATTRAWLALSNAPGVGPRLASRLVAHFGCPEAVLEAADRELAELGLKPDTRAALRAPDAALLDAALSWATRPDAHILTPSDPLYPPLLAEITDAPPVLFVRGDPQLLAEPQVAIVGSRNPTSSGLEVTCQLARQLVEAGVLVTSGLALGIDGAAHQAALEQGSTIAVLGTGPDRVYPAVHRELAHAIVARGALVSELPPGVGPLARHFPRRNRLISGLSLGVLVTEAAIKSGSLITARSALEQGRGVFAVPGSIRNPLARGCHALIREGATLVESAADILAELAPQLRAAVAPPPPPPRPPPAQEVAPEPEDLDADARGLLMLMGFDPVAPDELIARSGRPAEQVVSTLLFLELSGHVSSVPGGRYCRSRVG